MAVTVETLVPGTGFKWATDLAKHGLKWCWGFNKPVYASGLLDSVTLTQSETVANSVCRRI